MTKLFKSVLFGMLDAEILKNVSREIKFPLSNYLVSSFNGSLKSNEIRKLPPFPCFYSVIYVKALV